MTAHVTGRRGGDRGAGWAAGRRLHVVRRALTVAAAVLTMAGIEGCGVHNVEGGSTLSAAAVSVRVDPSIAAQVPAAVRSKRTLTIAADATYAPAEFMSSDGKTVIGFGPDLARAVAKLLGLRAEIRNVPFDSIIPGLAAGKYELGVSSFTDTREREKTVDFVTYATAGESFFVNASGGPRISSLDDLCGHTVAAQKGTTEAADAIAQSKRCTDRGGLPVAVSVFPDENGVNLALASGRVEVAFADTPVAAFAVRQSAGKFRLLGDSIQNAPYGIAISKGSGLQRPVLAAVEALIADGAYQEILRYWGLEHIAITTPAINGAIG